MRRIAVLDAPSNLGLRPPTPGSVPGCAKAPGALRDQGIVARLGARDAGCHTPPRFDPAGWRPGDGVSQAADIARYSIRLAERIGAMVHDGEFPVVLGGDCSIALGSALAMRRLAADTGSRVGLVYVDAHSDFRHPGNASVVGAAAGEALALVTGRGQPDLAAIEQRRPYVRDSDVVLVGLRATDEYRMDLQAGGFAVRGVPDVRAHGAVRTAQWARTHLAECAGYWVHLDVDVLDPSVMPAVDAPDPGGIAYPELEQLLRGLTGGPEFVGPGVLGPEFVGPEFLGPQCLGIEVTVFDPDFDVEGVYARDLVAALVAGLAAVGTAPGSRLAGGRGRDGSGPAGPVRREFGLVGSGPGGPDGLVGSGPGESGSGGLVGSVPGGPVGSVPGGPGGSGPAGSAHGEAVDDMAPVAPLIPKQPKRAARSRRATSAK